MENSATVLCFFRKSVETPRSLTCFFCRIGKNPRFAPLTRTEPCSHSKVAAARRKVQYPLNLGRVRTKDSRTNRPSSPLKENSWHRKVDVRGQLTKMRKENQADRNPYEKPASNARKNHPATVVCFKVHVCACVFLAEARIISCKLKLLSSSDSASGGSAHDHRSLWKSQSKPQAISGSWSSTWRNRGGLTISYHIWAHVKPLGPR